MDGDLLLRMTEDMLKDDIGISNGILRTRFVRELNNLKKMVNYSSCDSTGLNTFLQSISPELSVYTYQMLKSGVDKDYLRWDCKLTPQPSENFSNVNLTLGISRERGFVFSCIISFAKNQYALAVIYTLFHRILHDLALFRSFRAIFCAEGANISVSFAILMLQFLLNKLESSTKLCFDIGVYQYAKLGEIKAL